MPPNRKNDRPNKFDPLGRLMCYNPKNIPFDYASKSEWQRRGYKIKIYEQPAGDVHYWNGQSYLDYYLYNLNQVEPISGEKAAIRRTQYNNG